MTIAPRWSAYKVVADKICKRDISNDISYVTRLIAFLGEVWKNDVITMSKTLKFVAVTDRRDLRCGGR